MEVVINAEGLVAGRLASVVAKRLLRGERVVVVNAEKAVIVGRPRSTLEWYLKRVGEWRTYYNPEKRGPKIPRRPDRVLKRMVKGMLPRKKPRGRDALRRLRVYIGVPPEYRDRPMETVPEARRQNDKVPFMTLGDLYRALGGRI